MPADVHAAVSTGSTMHEPVSGWRPTPVEVRHAGSGHSRIGDRAHRIEAGELRPLPDDWALLTVMAAA